MTEVNLCFKIKPRIVATGAEDNEEHENYFENEKCEKPISFCLSERFVRFASPSISENQISKFSGDNSLFSSSESLDSEESELNLEETLKSLNIASKFSSFNFNQRRIRTKSAKSMCNLWLPGKSTQQSSFNCNCSKKYTKLEDKNERSYSSYYYPKRNM